MEEKYKDSKFVFVIGIGGSDLASKAIWSAMTLHKPEIKKRVFFLEAPDSRRYQEVEDFINNKIAKLEEICLIAISKSGRTAETLETFHKTFDILSEKFGEPITQRTLIISTEDTPLWKMAESRGMEKIRWDGDIGGRFSAFTVAHTTVLSIAGLDVESFMAGGKEIGEKYDMNSNDNPITHLAQNIFDNYKSGIKILDFFFFNSELEDLGKWCRQLIAESLTYITPTVSVGPTDLHSMLELYLGGPRNRFTIFVRSLHEVEGSVNEKAYQDATEAYKKAEMPFAKYEIEEINERELGNFMAYMIAVTLKLAKLLEVDPYDQPAVDEYKRNIKK